MQKKPTYEELEQRVQELEKEAVRHKKAEEALKELHRYTRELIEASLDPLVTISPEGKITDVNHATEVDTGYPRDKIIGTRFSEYFTDPRKARQGYLKVLREGHVRDYPLEIRHRDGKVMPVLYNASIYRDTEERHRGRCQLIQHISPEKLHPARQTRQLIALHSGETEHNN